MHFTLSDKTVWSPEKQWLRKTSQVQLFIKNPFILFFKTKGQHPTKKNPKNTIAYQRDQIMRSNRNSNSVKCSNNALQKFIEGSFTYPFLSIGSERKKHACLPWNAVFHIKVKDRIVLTCMPWWVDCGWTAGAHQPHSSTPSPQLDKGKKYNERFLGQDKDKVSSSLITVTGQTDLIGRN